MRIGILANSFRAAWRIRLGLMNFPATETFIILSPSPDRSVFTSYISNCLQLAVCSLKDLHKAPRALLFKRVVFLSKGFNDEESVSSVARLNLDLGLHKSGVIYRAGIINAFRLGILNPHIGLLPAYRGRNVMEWSLLNGDPVGITVFFIDTGIDTGSRIVVSEEVDISHCRSIDEAKKYLFNQDVNFFQKALRVLQNDNPSYRLNDASGRRYFVMSKLFQGVVEELLQS